MRWARYLIGLAVETLALGGGWVGGLAGVGWCGVLAREGECGCGWEGRGEGAGRSLKSRSRDLGVGWLMVAGMGLWCAALKRPAWYLDIIYPNRAIENALNYIHINTYSSIPLPIPPFKSSSRQ